MSDTEDDDVRRERQLKIVIVGNGSSGKTSIAARYAQDQFGKDYVQTIGVDFFLKRIVMPDNLNVALQVWDIGGQSIGGKMLDKYIYGSDGVMLVYDVTNAASFEDLEEWLSAINKICESSPKKPHKILVGNKVDMEHMRVIKPERHHQFVKGHGINCSCFVSAKTGESVAVGFLKLANDILGTRMTRTEIEQQQTVIKASITTNAPIQGPVAVLHPTVQTRATKSSACVVS